MDPEQIRENPRSNLGWLRAGRPRSRCLQMIALGATGDVHSVAMVASALSGGWPISSLDGVGAGSLWRAALRWQVRGDGRQADRR